MSTMTPVGHDSPPWKAWEEWKQSEEYTNAVNWLRQGNFDGELWCAFLAGWNRKAAALAEATGTLREDLEIEIRKLEHWILSTFVIALGEKGIQHLDELRAKLRALAAPPLAKDAPLTGAIGCCLHCGGTGREPKDAPGTQGPASLLAYLRGD